MDGEREGRRGRVRSFLIGGVVGASAALAAADRRRRVIARRRRRVGPPGLAAFEQAPCFQELVDEEEAAGAG